MAGLVGLLAVIGAVMVFRHMVLGVVFLVIAAFWVPMIVKRIHDGRVAARRRAEPGPDDSER